MRWKTHKTIGVAAYSFIIGFIYPIKDFLILLLLLLLTFIPYKSSVLPDKLDDIFNLEHREFSHSLLCLILLTLLFSLPFLVLYLRYKTLLSSLPMLSPIYGFISGYSFHLFADALTDNGIRFFWPHNIKNSRTPLFRLWYYNEGISYENSLANVSFVAIITIWLVRLISLFNL